MDFFLTCVVFVGVLFIWSAIKDIEKKLDTQDLDLEYIKDKLDE